MSRINGELPVAINSQRYVTAATAGRRAEAARPVRPLSGVIHGMARNPSVNHSAKPAAAVAAPSLCEVSSANTAGLSNMSRPKMMLSLSRVEAQLEFLLDGTRDPVEMAEMELGLKMVSESLRRLSLIQSGADALIGQ